MKADVSVNVCPECYTVVNRFGLCYHHGLLTPILVKRITIIRHYSRLELRQVELHKNNTTPHEVKMRVAK